MRCCYGHSYVADAVSKDLMSANAGRGPVVITTHGKERPYVAGHFPKDEHDMAPDLIIPLTQTISHRCQCSMSLLH